ncbi:DUF4179 domain-containing protein [Blautia schinkii]|nr:DUF4179 domain-containing protein [Blautia schinkii]
MLDNRDWANAAPEVPQEFHERFEKTLRSIETAKRPRRKMSFRILAVAAALCALCTATVAANEIFNWSDALVERFKPSQEQQQKLADSGNIQGIGQSVTQNGVTVTLDQAVMDKERLYMLFAVETPEAIKMDHTVGFDSGLNVTLDGKDILDAAENASGGGNGGFVDEKMLGGQSEHKRFYEINYNIMDTTDEFDFSNRTVGVLLENLVLGADKAMPGEVVAEGKWEFTWNTGEIQKGKLFEINETYDLGGYDILVKNVEITPLSYTVSADLSDALKVEEDERNTFEYNGDDPGMEIDTRIGVSAVEYADGTKIETGYFGGGTDVDEEEQSYIVTEGFNNVVDVDKIESIYIMQGEVKIPVK